jgi:hypothetical protein
MRKNLVYRACALPVLALVGTALSAVAVAPASAEGPGAIRPDAAFTANVLPANDDGSQAQVPLGFTADFFGYRYSSVFVNNNGNISFDEPLPEFTPFGLTPWGKKIIAPFFGDVDTRGAGSGLAMYGYGTGQVDGHTAFGVNWIDVGYYREHTDKRNSFQLVLIQREDTGNPNNFDIEMNYDKVQWETGDASGGVGGLGGDSARAGYSSGSGEALELPGSGVDGALLDTNTETGLVHNSMNSPQPGRYVFQVRNGVVVPPNTAPVAEAGHDLSGVEGSTMSLDARTSSDADGDTLSYAWSWSGDAANDAGADCVIAEPAVAATTITCDDEGLYTASLAVSDGTRTSTDSAAVTVANAAPQIATPSLTGGTGTACLTGNTVGLSFAVSDAGPDDVADLSGTVDWGDGTTVPYTGTSFTGSHTFAPGTYTVLVNAADADGGTSSAPLAGAVSHQYRTSGLMEPVDADGSSVFRLGSTIPLKIVVTDCDGALVTNLSPDVDLTKVDTSPEGAVNEVESSSAADDGDNMRWSTAMYIYNLSSKRSEFCASGSLMCSDGDLTPGTYAVTIKDPASNDRFAPETTKLGLR